MQAFPEAAGAAVETIVRQSTNGGLTWRRVAQIANSAANEGAPLPAEAVAVGNRTACVLSDPRAPTMDVNCTRDGGRSFHHAHTPRMPGSRYASVYVQGVNFVSGDLGWLEVVDSIVSGRQPDRYQTEIWATDDGGAFWRVAYASPIRLVPQLP